MTCNILQMANDCPYEQTFYARKFKVNFIQEQILRSPGIKVYCETSQMFIKTYFDVVASAFSGKIEVIALRRYLPEVIKSFYDLGYFSRDRPFYKNNWGVSPFAVTSSAIPIAPVDRLDQIDTIIAYLVDIESRAQRFKDQFPAIKVVDVRLEHLSTISHVVNLFEALRLEPTSATHDFLCYGKVNERSSEKAVLGTEAISLDYCQHRLDLYLSKASELGIPIPKSLATTRVDI